MRAHSFPQRSALLLLLFGAVFLGSCTYDRGQTTTDTTGVDLSSASAALDSTISPTGDVPFVESPEPVVTKMLELANVSEEDVVYDLGSGDGRIVIEAAQRYGARGVGIEIKPRLVERARQNAKEAGVSDLVTFRQGDLFEADIRPATVVTLYLLPSVNKQLRPKLFRELTPGTHVVSHDFDMDEWEPDSTWRSGGETVFRWIIPEEAPPFAKEEK